MVKFLWDENVLWVLLLLDLFEVSLDVEVYFGAEVSVKGVGSREGVDTHHGGAGCDGRDTLRVGLEGHLLETPE